jgi:hypothetical protein
MDCKNEFTLYATPWAPYTYGFFVITSLPHPRNFACAVNHSTAADVTSSLLEHFLEVREELVIRRGQIR